MQPLPLPNGWSELSSWTAIETTSRSPLWALIDGVVFRNAAQVLPVSGLQNCCLSASTDPDKRAMAPWLVRLDPGSQLSRDLATQPADSPWGLLLNSDAEMLALRQHLRRFTMIRTPADPDAPVYFRFYDPRVLLDLFAILPAEKLAQLSRPVSRWILPDGPSLDLSHRIDAAPASALLHPAAGKPLRYLTHRPPAEHAMPDMQGPAGGSTFAIDHAEAALFGQRQADRSLIYLARELAARYRDVEDGRLLATVRQAPSRAARFGLASTKQISTLAACMIEFGDDFPRHYPEAEKILTSRGQEDWQRRQALAAWMSRGRVLRQARGF
ncbi:DUF4123 domain-containing protein [Paracoccus sp. M683]|uniref:DUF4123 domain-containing protein n=1 Tax=Paracoccus sp. M683 TaxID=2594268 RepID=UPI00117E51D7|nr:DUF4123 domain-containing protein [Paracoccus sp. M683]TRW95212.1 DUF4123 domain-containing protein [Paracoccus sp. M683]